MFNISEQQRQAALAQLAQMQKTAETINASLTQMAAKEKAQPNINDIAKNAGAAGANFSDVKNFNTPSKDDVNSIRDNYAREMGYGSYNEALNSFFTKPSKSAQQTYQELYKQAGLDQLLNQIEGRKRDLAEKIGTINDNAWLSEASRSGRAKNLQEIANADIGNLQDKYKLLLGNLDRTMEQYSQDFAQDQRMNEAKFNFLHQMAEQEIQNKLNSNLAGAYNSYLEGASSVPGKPLTTQVGNTLLQFDSSTGAWNPVYTSPKNGGNNPGDISDSRYQAYTSALSSIQDKESREALINRLATRFYEIPRDIIAADVYSTYTDGFDNNIPAPTDYNKIAMDYKNAGWTREQIEAEYKNSGKTIPKDFKKALNDVFGKNGWF